MDARRVRGGVGKSRKPRRRNQDSFVIPRPLQLANAGMVHNHIMRYVTTGTVALSISYHNLLDAILTAATATVGYQLFDLVKIAKIEMWAYNPSGVTTLSLAFVGRALGVVGDDQAHSASSMGIEPAYLSAKPSAKCMASQFQPDTTNTAFNIYCPIATIVDIHLVYKSALEGYAPMAVTNALVAAQPGLIYYRGIDGAATAATKFTPAGTTQII
jgi:hypothetical protein